MKLCSSGWNSFICLEISSKILWSLSIISICITLQTPTLPTATILIERWSSTLRPYFTVIQKKEEYMCIAGVTQYWIARNFGSLQYTILLLPIFLTRVRIHMHGDPVPKHQIKIHLQLLCLCRLRPHFPVILLWYQLKPLTYPQHLQHQFLLDRNPHCHHYCL